MRILIVHQYYLSPGQPGGSRFNEFARFWTLAGHAVTVVAGNQNYATGHIPEDLRNRWIAKSDEGGILVWRCRVPRTYNRGKVGRMWAFAGFTLTSFIAAVRVARPDIIITSSPPLTVAITGWLLSRLRFRGAKWVFEVRDLWPESAVSTGVLRSKSIITSWLYWLEKLAYHSSDIINVLTPAFKLDIARRYAELEPKIVVVPNGADVHSFSPTDRENEMRHELGWHSRFVVLYAGAHGRANAIHQLVGAAEHLVDREDILIVSAGDGPDRVPNEEMARRKGLRNIIFLGPVAKERMPQLISAASVGAAVLQANPTFKSVYPNKVFDYMACAKPTLLAIDGIARNLVCDEARSGVFAEPEDSRDLAEKIRWLADHPSECRTMGENGRQWVLKNASRESLAVRYLTILEGLVQCSTTNISSAASTSPSQSQD